MVETVLGLAVIACVGATIWVLWRHLRAVRQLQLREDARRGRIRQASQAPGGSPGHPQVVASSAVIEPRSVSESCPACAARPRVERHAAETLPAGPRRIVTLKCPQCGLTWQRFFVIEQPNVQ